MLSNPGKRLFVDCTQAVLSGNDSFAGQLLPGLNYWMERLDMTQGLGSAGHHGLALGDTVIIDAPHSHASAEAAVEAVRTAAS